MQTTSTGRLTSPSRLSPAAERTSVRIFFRAAWPSGQSLPICSLCWWACSRCKRQSFAWEGSVILSRGATLSSSSRHSAGSTCREPRCADQERNICSKPLRNCVRARMCTSCAHAGRTACSVQAAAVTLVSGAGPSSANLCAVSLTRSGPAIAAAYVSSSDEYLAAACRCKTSEDPLFGWLCTFEWALPPRRCLQ